MIFYFSATGNTLWATRQIAEATDDRMVMMTAGSEPFHFTLDEGERIGFCFPVHGWRPPLIVRRFIKRLNIDNPDGHYAYALCTAGDTIGETLDILRDDLSAVGISLQASASLLMPESYIGLPFMDVDTTDNEKCKISASAERLKGIIDDILHCRPIKSKLDIGHWPRINSRIIGSFFVRRLITDKPFHVDKDKCRKCGICAAVCPVGDIQCNKDTYPQWLHNGHCLTCFNCYHHCPTHSIEYGSRTKNKGQYFFGRNGHNNN